MDLNERESERLLAWTTFKEWLCSDSYKERAKVDYVLENTSLGKEIGARKAIDGWQWYKGDERGAELRRLLFRIPQVWTEQGWATFETAYIGRPRRSEYSAENISKAHRLYREGHQFESSSGSYKWAKSVLGETVRTRYDYLFVLSAAVYREWVEEVGLGVIEGKTREELAQMLGVSKKVANGLVRWLLSTGTCELLKNNGRREVRKVNL